MARIYWIFLVANVASDLDPLSLFYSLIATSLKSDHSFDSPYTLAESLTVLKHSRTSQKRGRYASLLIEHEDNGATDGFIYWA